MRYMRTFLAIDFSNEDLDLLGKVIIALKKHPDADKIRWQPTNKLHLTVRFIGESLKSQLLNLKPILQNTLRKIPPFRIEFSAVSVFPNPRNPRVIVVDLSYSAALMDLFSNVENAVTSAGFPKEMRPARPHITIGRVEKPHLKDFHFSLAKAHQGTLVKDLVLYQSIPEGRGTKYIAIERYALGEHFT